MENICILYENLYIDRMETLSISATRANLKAVVERVVADKVPIKITRPKGEGVVLVSASEWESIEETLYLLQSPANAKHLMDGIAELDAGRGEEHELIQP
jgi:antitoxin YefM